MSITFEGYERRIGQIQPVMDKYGIKDFEDARKICNDKGFDPYDIVKGIQPIAFENAGWAYTLGAAIAVKKGCKKAADRRRPAGVLHPRLGRRPAQGRSRPRQPRGDAAARRDGVLLLPGGA